MKRHAFFVAFAAVLTLSATALAEVTDPASADNPTGFSEATHTVENIDFIAGNRVEITDEADAVAADAGEITLTSADAGTLVETGESINVNFTLGEPSSSLTARVSSINTSSSGQQQLVSDMTTQGVANIRFGDVDDGMQLKVCSVTGDSIEPTNCQLLLDPTQATGNTIVDTNASVDNRDVVFPEALVVPATNGTEFDHIYPRPSSEQDFGVSGSYELRFGAELYGDGPALARTAGTFTDTNVTITFTVADGE